jgi:hypothetical protein
MNKIYELSGFLRRGFFSLSKLEVYCWFFAAVAANAIPLNFILKIAILEGLFIARVVQNSMKQRR